MNRAASEAELAEVVTSELCEAFDAEFAFLLALRRGGGFELLGSAGLGAEQAHTVLDDALLTRALRAPQATIHAGEDLLGIGARAAAVARAGEALLVVARMRNEPFDDAERALLEAVGESTGHSLARGRLARERDDLFRRLEQTNLGIAAALAATLEAKDHYTADHARSIADLAVHVGVKMGMTLTEVRDLRLGAILHDIGKIAVPVELLTRTGKLTAAEFELVKCHPDVGSNIVARVDFPWPVADIVRQHHERYDGSGYPHGLAGEEIRLEARILTVADVVEAITHRRPYRAALGIEVAVAELRDHRGQWYDPRVVDACLELIAEGVVPIGPDEHG